jgi:drug/metabolite transporter (DMT)-like permease
MRPLYWIAMIVAAFGWASGGIATRAAFDEGVGAWTMIAIRAAIAAALVGIVMLVKRMPRPSRTVVRFGLVQSVFNLTIPYVLFTFAYDEASVGFVALFAALIPMATGTFAHFMLPDEPLSVKKLAALFVSFAGVAFLLLSGDSGLDDGGRPLLAAGLALTAVGSIGYAAAFAKRNAGTYHPLTITGLQFGLASVWLLVAMFAIEGAPTDLTANGWYLIVVMAVAATFMPFLIYFWLLEKISATDASLIGYIVPLIALVGGLILLDEQLQSGIIVGGGLVFAGLVLADQQSRREQRASSAKVQPGRYRG